MLWQLAHFGLELSSPQDLLKQSLLEVTTVIDDEQGVFAALEPLEGSVTDPKLDGLPTEQTLLDTMGHIVLEVPVPRPECLDQIVELVNKRLPFDLPLVQFPANCKSTSFYFVSDEDGDPLRKVNPQKIYSHLLGLKEMVIHGDQFTEHNVKALPSEMMIKILPVPSLLARSSENTRAITDKLNTILRLNNTLRSQMCSSEPVEMIIADLVELISYHVMTYLDNAIPGVPSDDCLPSGIAQLIGTDASLFSENASSSDIAGTALHRIVRGINMGEAVLNLHTDLEHEPENLAFELCKQIAFDKIWSRSEKDTQLIYINDLGEVQRMLIGVIEELSWSPWNGNYDIERNIVVAPRFSDIIIEDGASKDLSNVITKLKEIDPEFSLGLGERRALNFLYNLLEQKTNSLEQQIIVCDSSMDSVILRPFLRQLKGRNKIGSNVSLLLTKARDNSAVNYIYEKTPDDFRNLIVALTNLNERREFEYKQDMFKHIRPTDLKLISTFVKGLTRKEMTQILGEVIIEKGWLDPDFLRNYIVNYLTRSQRPILHLKPNPRTPRRRLTLEEIYDHNTEVFGNEYATQLEKEVLVENGEEGTLNGSDSYYDSLKGLEPLVQWAKLKGKLFTPEAAEYGFINYPRGLLLTGVPGCGKTMAAKVIAQEWGMALHRVNPDDITSRFMGGNEENMRKLLDKLESNAPSICFVDEAEKLFGEINNGMNGAASISIDSTESMLLQFMEENEKPVFFIFTCNNLDKMSPAIIDRFDARFFVDLPDDVARQDIIRLMLKERKQGLLNIDIKSLVNKSQKFTGRDIRGAVEEAMMVAFADGRKLKQEDLELYFSNTKPTSTIHAEKIEKIRHLVKEGKVRMANSTRIKENGGQNKPHDVSFG